MEELNLPVQGSVVGEIVKVDAVPEALRVQLNTDATVVTVQDFNGKNHPIWFSDNQIAEFGLKSILFLGNVVSVDTEERIEGQTQYIDAVTGNTEFHEATITAGRNAAHASAIVIMKEGVGTDFVKMIEEKRAAVTATARVRTVNFDRLGTPAIDGLPVLIKELKEKRERAGAAYKDQYDRKIAMLEKQLADATPAPAATETEKTAGGSQAKNK